MGFRRIVLIGSATVTSLMAAGCYSYIAVQPELVAPGEEVRALLRPERGWELGEQVIGNGPSVDGEFLARDDGHLVLYVAAGTRQVGFHTQVLNQRVQIPEAAVLGLERRELHRGRTAVAMSAAALGVAVLAWKALGGTAGGNTATPPVDGPAPAQLLGVSVPFQFDPPGH